VRLRAASLYPHARGSVLVPLMLLGLPEAIHALNEDWALKDEFHVTAADTPWLAERAGVPREHAWRELAAALEGRRAGPVRVGDELRLVRDRNERSLIVMARVDGLGELYAELAGRLGAPLAPPPAHITLYTRPGGTGDRGPRRTRAACAHAAVDRRARVRGAESDRLGLVPRRYDR
jgi:hypothetical protein